MIQGLPSKPEGICFHCESFGGPGMVQIIEGLEEHVECVDQRACEQRIRSHRELIGVTRSACKFCNAPVYIANSDGGEHLAIDAEPYLGGPYYVETIDRGQLYVTRFRRSQKDRLLVRIRYRAHAVTCTARVAS